MRKTRRWILSFVLCCTLMGLLFPQVSCALDAAGTKSIRLGGNVSEGEFLYYGNYKNEDIKWKVLSEDGNGGTYQDSGKPLFLMSEYLLDYVDTNEGVQFDTDRIANSNQTNPNEWQYSDGQKWCSLFTSTAFDTKEAAAIHKTSKKDEEKALYNTTFGTGPLKDEQVFFISVDEAASYISDQDGGPGLGGATSDGRTPGWWLRSYDPDRADRAVCSIWGGWIMFNGVNVHLSARPAFNLNLDSVLFLSAAEGGKDNAAAGSGILAAAEDYNGDEWKATIKDANRKDFDANIVKTADKTFIEYSNARTGSKEYLSAMIKSADNTVKYYGRLANLGQANDSSGRLDIEESEFTDKMENGDTLYIFNEQYNGEKKSDYSSDLIEVNIPEQPNDKEATPAAQIDYESETLTGLAAGEYTIQAASGQAKNYTVEKGVSLSIEKEWMGKKLSIIKKGNGTTILDSAAQTLAIPERPGQPAGLGKQDETVRGKNDGSITGTTAAMEYRLKAETGQKENRWKDCQAGSTGNLVPGTYEVRYKAVTTAGQEAFASAIKEVTIGKGAPADPANQGGSQSGTGRGTATGDDSNLLLPGILLLAAAGTLVTGRRKKQR